MRGRGVMVGCLVASALAGCGGGGDATTTTTEPAALPTATTVAPAAPTTVAAPPPTAAPVVTAAPATTIASRPSRTPQPPASTTVPADPPPPAGPVSVAITDFVYDPDPVRVRAGASVTWTNNDSAPHTATAQDGGWDSSSIAKGESSTVRFDTPGTYPYTCTLHPTMKGRVIVV